MNLEQIAELIPEEYRKEVLELEMIDTAIANSTNPAMHYLAVIWKQYVEKNFDPTCNLCYARVLKSFQAIKHTMVNMEVERKKLEQI